MNYRSVIGLLACLTATVLGAPSAAQNVEPVHEELRHRLVFDSPPFRLFNARIPPGDVSAMHRHENPTFYIVLGTSLMRNREQGEGWSNGVSPGDVGDLDYRDYRAEIQVHQVENIGDSEFNMLGFINASSGDPEAAADPDAEFENVYFRASRLQLAVNAETIEHRHDYPVVVVQVSGGRSQVLVADVPTAPKTVFGNWSWHEAGELHRLHNTGRQPVELIEVELKH